MSQNQSNLEQIFDYAYPANHLLRISILKDLSDNSPRSSYFALITLLPGVQSGNGRTYDSQSRITMKQSLPHLLAVAKYIKRLCTYTNQNFVGETVLMSDASKSAYGGSELKVLTIGRGANNNNNMVIWIGMSIKGGNNYSIALSPGIAEALADIIETAALKAIELELAENAERTMAAMQQRQTQQNIPTGQINQPASETPPFLQESPKNASNDSLPFANNNDTPFTTQNVLNQENVNNNVQGNKMVNNFEKTLNQQQVPNNIEENIDTVTVPTPPF